MLRVERQQLGELVQEAPGKDFVGTVVAGFVGIQRRIVPHRLAIAPPEAVQRPARQLFARIPFALPEMLQALRRVPRAQALKDFRGAQAFGRPERVDVPFGAVVVVNRDESRFAAHRQAHVGADQIRVDLVAQRFDRRPLLLRHRAW
jgi:hypothetical protein